MAKNYEIEEYMHNSIYSERVQDKPYSKRKAKIYFSEPEGGINEKTGILLLIAGFYAHSNSKVYKKMREQFADEYNLVTVQCDYFGYEFMQGSESVKLSDFTEEKLNEIFSKEEVSLILSGNKPDFDKMLEIAASHNMNLELSESLSGECLDNFNDMGIMQTLDNLAAILKVMSIIYENGYVFNTKKVIIYGQSQGAYLGYLCNRFCPTLFSLIIDNSSWLYPAYFLENRILNYNREDVTLVIAFEYLAKKLNLNPELLDLNYLYSNFENKCAVICYHGVTDELIPSLKKSHFCRNLDKCSYNEITRENLDNEIFKSTDHGLGTDFFKLFHHTMKNIKFAEDTFFNLTEEVDIKTSKEEYYIDYKDILPIFNVRNDT